MTPSESRVSGGPHGPTGLVERGGADVATWGIFEGRGLEAVVTTRDGGVSEGPFASLNLALHVGDEPDRVLENRRRALSLLGAGLEELIVAEQVHGAHVSVVGAAERSRGARSTADAIGATDALVTSEGGVVVSILVADCAPVALFDPASRVLGCAHAGWRGATGGVIEATIGAMAALGARPGRVLAGIGPCVGEHAYEVGGEVLDAARRHLGAAGPWARPGRAGHFWFDLAGYLEVLLHRAGVAAGHIERSALETGPSGPFFSARAEGTCGRFGLLARIEP